MNIPNYENTQAVEENGYFTDYWQILWQQLFTELQANAGNEGLVVPTLSSDPNSVDPPAVGGQLAQIQTTAQNGTLVYDTFTNELKVRLNDGTFHVIV